MFFYSKLTSHVSELLVLKNSNSSGNYHRSSWFNANHNKIFYSVDILDIFSTSFLALKYQVLFLETV
jgi:hypothetical protein